MNLRPVKDLHHVDPTTVEYFHNTVACSRYDDGLRGELTEVDLIVQIELELMVVQ